MRKEAIIILVALATPFFLSLIWLMRVILHGFSETFTGIYRNSYLQLDCRRGSRHDS